MPLRLLNSSGRLITSVSASQAGLAGIMIVAFGVYDVSASKPHSAPVDWLLHTTMIQSVRARAGDAPAAAPFSAAEVRRGFAVYDSHCVACHGGPGVPRAQWSAGLMPAPPYLLDAARRWSPAELRFIVGHGVKMTAMPAWDLSLPPSDVTSLVAFLEALPDLAPAQYQAMRQKGAVPPAH